MALRWYVVHVYSGSEKKVAEAIKDQISRKGMEEYFSEVLVPTEEVVEVRRGVRVNSERKFFPGYILINMELSDETAVLITTRGSDMRLEGDLNYDEVIDIYDLMLLVDFNLGYEGQVNPFFGDINGDGMVNVMDLISLIQMIMGYNQD